MSAPRTPDGSLVPRPDEPQPPPLLPTFATKPGAAYRLRAAVTRLRDRAPDESLRRKLTDVLEGRLTLRALADDPEFQAFTTPRAQRTMAVWDRMAPEDRDRLVQEVRAQEERRQEALRRAREDRGPSAPQ